LITKLHKYVTKFSLPPHPCESVPRIWRANIFFDKTGSDDERNLIGHRHATLAGQEPLGRTYDAVSFGKGRHTHRRFLLLKYVTKFRLPPHPCESVPHLESQYLL
jgi:hypothetical protein